MRRDRKRFGRAMAAVAMAGASIAVASCEQVLDLQKYKSCPGDPGCPPETMASCTDGIQNGDETDVDCGGSCPTQCAATQHCKVPTDCLSNGCVNGLCPADACTDGVKDNGESDTDCGGPCAKKCDVMASCNGAGDCASGVCTGGSCRAPTCTDGVANGNETDVDCGGPICGKCIGGQKCAQPSDCASMVCTNGKCEATCTDGVKDGAETDVDCGGPMCKPCADSRACATGSDCASGICLTQKCTTAEIWAQSFDDMVPGARLNPVLAVDQTDNPTIAGDFDGTLDLGSGAQTTPGFQHWGFFGKRKPDGSWLSSTFVPASGTLHLYGVAAAGTNAFVVGDFAASAVNFGTAPTASCPTLGRPAGITAATVAKLNGSGVPLWCKAFGISGSQGAEAAASDSFGNSLVVAGYLYGGDADFGNGTHLTGTGAFVVRLNSNGDFVWSQELPSSGLPYVASVARDSAGNAIVAGTFQGSITIGGSTYNSSGANGDTFLAKFDATAGTPLWSRSLGGPSRHIAVAVDPTNDHIFVTGGYGGTISFGMSTLPAASGLDVYLASLDASGIELWAKSFGDPAKFHDARSIALDKMGQPVIGGAFTGTIDFGGGTLTSNGAMPQGDVFLAKFDPMGKHIWSHAFGDSAGQDVRALAVDSASHVLVTGTFNGSLSFGVTQLTNPGGTQDMFLAKLRTP